MNGAARANGATGAVGRTHHSHATIHLHPEDASLVRSYYGEQLAHAGNRIQEDRSMGRGGCSIEAGGSQIDESLATRWQRVVATLGSNSAWLAQDVPPEVDKKQDT